MVKYPLTAWEVKVVGWTGRLISILAVATIALLATISLASP